MKQNYLPILTHDPVLMHHRMDVRCPSCIESRVEGGKLNDAVFIRLPTPAEECLVSDHRWTASRTTTSSWRSAVGRARGRRAHGTTHG